MTCCRMILMAVSLLIPMTLTLPVSAEPEKDDTAKIEQRKSGGNLLRFFFGEEDEADEPIKEETNSEGLISGEDKSEEPSQPSVIQPSVITTDQIVTDEIENDPVSTQPASAPSTEVITAPETTPKEVVLVPGEDRDGLAPPPGFTETVPAVSAKTTATTQAKKLVKEQVKEPAQEIVVEQIPAALATQTVGAVTEGTDTGETTSETEELARLSKENPVVAIVEGDHIYWEDIMQAARKLPEQYQGQLETMFPLLLDRAIDLKLLAHAGSDADIDRTEVVKRKLALAEERIIRDAFLEQQLDEMISESMLKDRYFSLLRENITNAEIRARHILVDTRNEALALIIALENGAKFPLLAKKFSRGPSAERGGDLGWFKRKDMDPEFAASAFELKRGEFTKMPVSTEFGWHVILLDDKRDVKQPTFDSMRGEIKEIISRDLVAVMLRDLRKDADISVFPAK